MRSNAGWLCASSCPSPRLAAVASDHQNTHLFEFRLTHEHAHFPTYFRHHTGPIMSSRRATLAVLLLLGLMLVVADEAPPAEDEVAETAGKSAAEAAPVAGKAGSIMDRVKKIKAPKVVGGGYAKQAEESKYSETASYGAPHFLIMCILLVFMAAGCKEAYDR